MRALRLILLKQWDSMLPVLQMSQARNCNTLLCSNAPAYLHSQEMFLVLTEVQLPLQLLALFRFLVPIGYQGNPA